MECRIEAEMKPDWVSADGNIQLFLADCLTILPQLEAGSVDACVTDPPYGIGLTAKQHKWFDRKGTGYAPTFDDSPEFVQDVVIPSIAKCRMVARVVVVTPGPKCLWLYPQPDGWGVIFNKAGSGIGPWGFQCAQPVLYYGKCPYTARGLGNRPSSWEQSPVDYSEKCDHPCPKPLGMVSWLVCRASLGGETILDPFMGSGTTGVACVKTGRRFIGIEIDPGYFAIARKRIEAAIEQQAGGPLFRECQQEIFP